MRPEQPPIKSIFFDIGDTLLFDDPPLQRRLAQAALAVGPMLDEARLPAAFRIGEAYAMTRYVAGIPWDAPDSLHETIAQVWVALGRLPLGDDDWARFAMAFQEIPFTRAVTSQALDLLQTLRERGFIVGAISDWEATLPALLTELRVLPLLDALAVSAIVGVTKPHPRLFQEALRQAEAAPETSLHVGDWYELDAAGARAAGMQALLFDHQNRRPDADCPRVTTFEKLAEYLLCLPIPEGRKQGG
jgi:HAD superfamily hydrolase (TIGR01549 family)